MGYVVTMDENGAEMEARCCNKDGRESCRSKMQRSLEISVGRKRRKSKDGNCPFENTERAFMSEPRVNWKNAISSHFLEKS